MRSFRLTIFALLMVFAITSGAIADVFDVCLTGHGDITTSSQLDEVFTDSLTFHDFTGAYTFYDGITNYFAGVRFTAPNDFQLQGIRFYARTPENIITVEVGVYTNNSGQPGTLLLDMWDSAPTSVTGGWVELVLAEADYLDLDAGEDFWIVIGPMNNWQMILDTDGCEPGDRNKASTSSATNLNYVIDNDYVLIAGGEILGGFYDLKAYSLFNDIQRFQFEADSTVTLSARVVNIGNTASSAGTATFSITNSEGTEVFTEDVAFDAVGGSAADTALVTCTTTWSPTANGRYMASVDFVGEDGNESITDNNNFLLVQDVIDFGDWLAYDDGTFESATSNQAGSGWGVIFEPLSYPAKIDSMTWHFPDDATSANLRVYVFDSFNPEPVIVWEYSGAVVEGANTFEIDDDNLPNGINTADGVFIGAYMQTGDLAFAADSNPPTAAANPDMPAATASIDANGMYYDVSGNWGVQAKIIEGSEPARVQLVLPSNPVLFGDVAIGETATMYYVFENQGSLAGTIESVTIQGSSYDPDEFSCTNTFPMTVTAESVDSLEFVWTPGENTPGLGVGMWIEHNDPVLPTPHIVEIRGTALGVDVISTDAIPDNYFLAQNHPNPFNPETSIQFGLPNAGHVRLTVYNVMGQEVARLVDSQMNAGTFAVTLDGSKLSSGIYFYSLEANGFHSMKKMSLLK